MCRGSDVLPQPCSLKSTKITDRSPTVRNAKINLQNNTHNITSTTHPTLTFYLQEAYRICNFLANCFDYTRKQITKHQFPEAYETSSKTGPRIRILYLLTDPHAACAPLSATTWMCCECTARFFVPGNLELWPLTLTFKLIRAEDQTRFLCEFGAN